MLQLAHRVRDLFALLATELPRRDFVVRLQQSVLLDKAVALCLGEPAICLILFNVGHLVKLLKHITLVTHLQLTPALPTLFRLPYAVAGLL